MRKICVEPGFKFVYFTQIDGFFLQPNLVLTYFTIANAQDNSEKENGEIKPGNKGKALEISHAVPSKGKKLNGVIERG